MTDAPTPNLSQLERKLERHAREAERLHRAAAEARRVEAAEREAELNQQARHLLKTYDSAALDADDKRALDRLRQAILGDAVSAAAIDLLAARISRYVQAVAVNAAASRLGENPPAIPRVGAFDLPEYVATLIGREAAGRAEDQREHDAT